MSVILAFVGLLTAVQGVPSQRPAEICSSAPYREFDFVLGKHALHDEKGDPIADEQFASEMGGCVIHEYFRLRSGETAESFSFFDPVEKKWFQYAVGLHLVFRVSGGLKSGAMVLEGTATHLNTGKVRPLRLIWSPKAGGRISEALLEQDTASQEWRSSFAGELVRTPSRQSAGDSPNPHIGDR